jgi:predicted RNA-binding Zn-ribbon protein involved in translation (DUF1610 family)
LQIAEFLTVDLTKIRGKGDFKCPKCGIRISPDDNAESAYTILGTAMKGENLDKIVLQCNSCGSQISLVGFSALQQVK